MSGHIDPGLYRNNLQFEIAHYLTIRQSSQPLSDGGLSSGETSAPSVPPSPHRTVNVPEKQQIFRFVPQKRLPSIAAAPSPPSHTDIGVVPMTVRQAAGDANPSTWAYLAPPSSPSEGSTTTETSSSSPGPRTPSRPPSPGEEQIKHDEAHVSKATTVPLKWLPHSSSPPPPKAPSRRQQKAKLNPKSTPYTVAPLVKKAKDEPLPEDVEAYYAALVEEAVKDPANKYYRRDVIERSIRGPDYRPKKKTRNRRANIPSNRAPGTRAQKVDDTPTTTATPSYESPRRSGHDIVEHLSQQQVAEGSSLVHRPIPYKGIDNRGRPASGIASWVAATVAACPVSPVPSALFMTEQGQECSAFGSLENPWANPTDFEHPFDLATPSLAPSYPMVQSDSFENEALSFWMDPLLNPFGNPGSIHSAPSSSNWDLPSSSFAELLVAGGNTWTW